MLSRSPSTVKAWENDIHTPAMDTQVKIEQKLNLPVGALTNDIDYSLAETLKKFNDWIMKLPPEQKKKAAEVIRTLIE